MISTTKNPVIYAPVFVPDTPDCEYKYGEQKLSKEKIRYLAKTFQEYKLIDLQHEVVKQVVKGNKPPSRGRVLGSFITRKEMKLRGLDGIYRNYPMGTWVLKVEITDKTAMMLYKQGELTGLSATTLDKNKADIVLQYLSTKNSGKKHKRILLSDIKNPVVFTVSLVKKPCVNGAKFCNKSCILKNTENMEDNNMSIMDAIRTKINETLEDIDLEELEVSNKEDVVEDDETSTEEEIIENEEPEKEEEESEEEEEEEEVLESSAKSYLTKEEATEFFKAGFQEIRGDIESYVNDTIEESITAITSSTKEDLGYVTIDEAKELFKQEFNSFQEQLESSLKERQEESIKQFSKSIESNTTIIETPTEPSSPANKLFADRDANGCKIR